METFSQCSSHIVSVYNYFSKFIFINFLSRQTDIGLRRFRTKELFLHLLVPTLTIIFTAIQLHYFHRPFMKSVWQPNPTMQASYTNDQKEYQYRNNKKANSFTRFFSIVNKKIWTLHRHWFRPTKHIIWRFLEVHMIKVVTLASFICAISEICCFNFFLVVLSLLSVCVNHFLQRVIFRIATFWICVLILMKMIYQINYLDQTNYDYKCVSIRHKMIYHT